MKYNRLKTSRRKKEGFHLKKKKWGGILTYEAKMLLAIIALLAMWLWVLQAMCKVVATA